MCSHGCGTREATGTSSSFLGSGRHVSVAVVSPSIHFPASSVRGAEATGQLVPAMNFGFEHPNLCRMHGFSQFGHASGIFSAMSQPDLHVLKRRCSSRFYGSLLAALRQFWLDSALLSASAVGSQPLGTGSRSLPRDSFTLLGCLKAVVQT